MAGPAEYSLVGETLGAACCSRGKGATAETCEETGMSKFIVLGLDGACPDIIHDEIENGRMPNFKRLREMGCRADNLPFPSAVTPGNWTAIATGSKPWTIGISDFCMHTPGEPLDEMHEVFSKRTNNRAQFAWDALSDRGVRVATIAFPGALPQTSPNHLAIGNYGCPAENADPYTLAPSRALVAGDLNPVGPYDWREYESVTLGPPEDGPGVDGFEAAFSLRFTVRATNPGYSGEVPFTLLLGHLGSKPAGALIDGKRAIVVGTREWTPFIEKRFRRDPELLASWVLSPPRDDSVTAEVRMRIVELDLERGELLLYISTVYPKRDFATDQELADDLRDRFGPYSDNLVISRLLMGWLDDEAFYDEFRLQGVWEARAAIYLVNERGFAGVFAKWHAFDKFYHLFMQKIDPAALNYDPSERERYERLHRKVLAIGDEMVGIALDGLRDDTSLVVISDHGLMASRRAAWVNRLLARHGYIHYAMGEAGKVLIDWSRTRAYVSSFLLLNLNLKGRDPDGIVEPGQEAERLIAELVELLRGWKDPETGTHIMADVFEPKKDGAFYGLGSGLDGDIRYFTAPGYTLYRSISVDGDPLVTDVAGPYLGDHGSCRPSARFGRGGEIGIFYAAGRGFRRNHVRLHPILPCDVMPTLLHIAGQAPTAHQEGAVLRDLLARPDSEAESEKALAGE